ncbi:hypothetical protein [Microbacterium lacticum]
MSVIAPIVLLDPPAALRRLRADEAPYPGTLHAGDPQTVHVDVDLLPAAVWRCRPDGHLLVPHDLARTADGHAAVMIHCPERLVSFVGAATRPGEAVTIAVSVLRAAEEARRAGIEAGAWWVDAGGRPVLAAGGDRRWAGDAADLLAELAELMRAQEAREAPALWAPPASRGEHRTAREVADALDDAARLVAAPRLHAADVASCEEALFAAAAPEALARAASDGAEESIAPRRADSLRRTATPEAAESWLARFTDAEWAGRVAEALRSLVALPARMGERRRERSVRAAGSARRGGRAARAADRGEVDARSRRGGGAAQPDAATSATGAKRRAPLLIAAAVGAVVLVGGLLWPEPGSRAADGAPVSPSPGSASAAVDPAATAAADASADPATEPAAGDPATPDAVVPPATTPPSEGGDLEEATRQIVRAVAACTPEPESCAVLREDATAAPLSGLVTSPTEPVITLVDEYGGVAVFRLEPAAAGTEPPTEPAEAEATGSGAAQILVLVSVDGKWLIRDVYDVADQP